MAAALAEDDLRLAVEAESIFGVAEGENDVSLILMLVHQRYGRSWPAPWQGRAATPSVPS